MESDLHMLKPKVRESIISALRDKRYERMYNLIDNVLLIYIAFVIFKNINAFKGYFSLYVFIEILFPLIIYLIISKITGEKKKCIKKRREKIKAMLMEDICNCQYKCNCREEVLKLLKSQSII